MSPDAPTTNGLDVTDHVLATSEPEPPEETVARLFGDRDAETTDDVLAAIATLFDAAPSGGAGVGPACPDVDELAPAEETRHEVHVGDSVEYAHCADGALFTAELVDHTPVTVRSLDPVSDAPVTFEIAADERTVRPSDAVVSIGMAEAAPDGEDMLSLGVRLARHGDAPEIDVDDPVDLLCRNVNAFERLAHYEEWASERSAVTVAVPADAFMDDIRRLSAGLRDD